MNSVAIIFWEIFQWAVIFAFCFGLLLAAFYIADRTKARNHHKLMDRYYKSMKKWE